jgi:hypothetical protein
MTWEAFHHTKQRLSRTAGARCPGLCGRKPTQSHHLWLRRPDHPYLQDPVNVALVCPDCHLEESHLMQVQASLDKLWAVGPDAIEAYVAGWPGKAARHLPGFYYDALELYSQGKRTVEE